MVSSLERRLLRELRANPKKRMRFSERFHDAFSQQTGLFLRGECVEALDYILQNVDPENPLRVGIIVEGSLQQRIKGHLHRRSGLIQYSVRVGGATGTSVYLPPPAPEYLDAYLELTAKKATVTWRSQGETVKVSSFTPKEYFTHRELRKEILGGCNGIFLSEIDLKRRIRYANTDVSIPSECKSSVFLTVYYEGEVYHFDLSKRIIFPSTGTSDFMERQRLEKASRLYEEARDFDYESYRQEVIQYLVDQWEKDPPFFDGKGRLVIVNGRCKVQIGSDGHAAIAFTDDNGRRNTLGVSLLYANSGVEAEFRGKVVFFHHESGLLNAYKAQGIGFQRSHFEGNHSLEYIALRNLDPQRGSFRLKVDGAKHYFPLQTLLPLYSSGDVTHCALMYHRKIEDNPTFKLVVRSDNGTRIEEVKPSSVY